MRTLGARGFSNAVFGFQLFPVSVKSSGFISLAAAAFGSELSMGHEKKPLVPWELQANETRKSSSLMRHLAQMQTLCPTKSMENFTN